MTEPFVSISLDPGNVLKVKDIRQVQGMLISRDNGKSAERKFYLTNLTAEHVLCTALSNTNDGQMDAKITPHLHPHGTGSLTLTFRADKPKKAGDEIAFELSISCEQVRISKEGYLLGTIEHPLAQGVIGK
jgi:hypothetical protein